MDKHCIHYNGLEMIRDNRATCRADVDPVLSFCDGDRTGWVYKAPCFSRNTDAPICPARQFRTDEQEIQRYEERSAQMKQSMLNISTVRPLIIAEHEETGKDNGRIECPVCKNSLIWSRAPSNGHVHARCETEGCVAWIE